jgi:hypothetical protein
MPLSFTGRIAGCVVSLVVPLVFSGQTAFARIPATGAPADTAKRRDSTFAVRIGALRAVRDITDSLRGRSGKLFMRFIAPVTSSGTSRASSVPPAFATWFGGGEPQRPGVYPVADSTLTRPFSVVALHPFSTKRSDRIGSYRLGFWPAERRRSASASYSNPLGFIEVTSDAASSLVSEHFRLGDFLTHDQAQTWPKYLVLREELIDKLELVIGELERSGISVRTMKVMSGFRTPRYNAKGGNTAGRAELSRHMYGDAADVFVDNDNDGRMDDLNRDGRIDSRDAKVIVAAAEKVERAHIDLVGGAGVYKATSSHGPFAHIDVRGSRARWGRM